MDLVREINHFYYRMSQYELQTMNGGDDYARLSYHSILYLNLISQMKECTASKIAEALRVTKSAVTLKTNELEKKGLVERTQSAEDKRVYYLSVSAKIQKVMNIYDKVFFNVDQELRAKYTPAELDLFGKILEYISAREWAEAQHVATS